MQLLAPVACAVLLLVFSVPALAPAGAKISARLSALLPLQSSILLGLAGLPGAKLPYISAKIASLNFLESYSYGIYVLQFIVYHVWPTKEVGAAYFLALACSAVLVVHLVQKPVEAVLLKLGPRRVWLLPVIVSVLLLFTSALPDPYSDRSLPPYLDLGSGAVDLRLPVQAEGSRGDVVINPSLLFRDGGLEVVIAARRHRRTSERSAGVYKGKDVIVLEETWHSEVVLGTVDVEDAAWTKW